MNKLEETILRLTNSDSSTTIEEALKKAEFMVGVEIPPLDEHGECWNCPLWIEQGNRCYYGWDEAWKPSKDGKCPRRVR